MQIEKPDFTGILRKAGIREGSFVLDFGCGSGDYTIAAALVVGESGRVYALDKERRKLDELSERVRSEGLSNIALVHTKGGLTFELEPQSFHAVLLFDVLHGYYFPEKQRRRSLLAELRRIMKTSGVLLVYPTHTDKTNLKEEIELSGFRLERQSEGRFLHDGNMERGSVLVFRKLDSAQGALA